MADQPVVQVSRLLDERGLSSFQIKLIVWSFFIVLIDGYDIAAIAFAAPSLAKEWAFEARLARSGVQRQPDRHPVRLGHLRLGRRPLWPQGGAGLARICCSAYSPWPPPIRPISIKCSGCGCWRA